MAFDLEPINPAVGTLQANAWTWRPMLGLLARERLLDGETLELAGYNSDVVIPKEKAESIAAFLDSYLAPSANGGFVRNDLDVNPVYGEWLAQFRDFCRRSQGFRIG